MNQKELYDSFVDTIKSPELGKLTTDFTEIAIDQLFEAEGLVRLGRRVFLRTPLPCRPSFPPHNPRIFP